MLVRRGFTLIEIVVVISIIAILSIVVMQGYNRTLQRQRLSLIADDLITKVNEQRRTVSSNSEADCLGIELTEEVANLISAPFLGRFVGCDHANRAVVGPVAEGLTVKSITHNGQPAPSGLVVYYKPPNAELEFPNIELWDSGSVFELEIGVGNGEGSRTLYFSALTGQVLLSDPRQND